MNKCFYCFLTDVINWSKLHAFYLICRSAEAMAAADRCIQISNEIKKDVKAKKKKTAEAEYDTLMQKANEKLREVGRIDRGIERKYFPNTV